MSETVRINMSKVGNVSMGTKTLNGWTAGVGRPRKSTDGKTAITMTESLIYPTKEQAWETIKKQVENLDFDKESVVFNQQEVTSLQEVQDAINELK